LPEYELFREEGADHAKKFFIRCTLTDDLTGVEAVGNSRRKAEQAAAKLMLESLKGNSRK
jgi:ribonuclease-3